MSTAELACDGLSKRYSRAWVLRDVQIDLPAGSLAAVVGANGSGKSTLLSLIAGVSRPTEGVVRARPMPVAWVPERFPATTDMTAIDYLTHMGRIRGLAPTVAAGRARQLLGSMGLVPGPDAALRSLSKGNAQKVAIAQALLGPAGLLVLDEPWAGLDHTGSQVLDQLIADARDAGSVVVVSTHDAPALENASHVLALRNAEVKTHAAGEFPLVRPAADPRPLVMVRLTPSLGAIQLETTDLDASSEHGDLLLRVPKAAVDGLLVEAVRRGWSITTVVAELDLDGTLRQP